MLLAGTCAGPLLVTSSIVQGVLRHGFDFRRHPPSALALGPAGPVQQMTFAVAGLLLVAGALHGVLFPLGFAALIGTAALMGRRYGRAGRRSMQVTAYLAAGASLALSLWPNLGGGPEGRFLPMWAGIVIGYAWMSMMFVDLRRQALAPRSVHAQAGADA